jgi:hypothetical protein
MPGPTAQFTNSIGRVGWSATVKTLNTLDTTGPNEAIIGFELAEPCV